jgi:light-independent protochlorophyllide reductase subunit B
MMGLEEHLIQMFREDFEFHGNATPSHLGHAAEAPRHAAAPPAAPADAHAAAPADAHAAAPAAAPAPSAAPKAASSEPIVVGWAAEAERELHKIPFFVRGKARRNTERFARERGVATITVETLYDAKAHFSS